MAVDAVDEPRVMVKQTAKEGIVLIPQWVITMVAPLCVVLLSGLATYAVFKYRVSHVEMTVNTVQSELSTTRSMLAECHLKNAEIAREVEELKRRTSDGQKQMTSLDKHVSLTQQTMEQVQRTLVNIEQDVRTVKTKQEEMSIQMARMTK